VRGQSPGAARPQPLVNDWLAPDITSANQVIADLALLIQHVVEHGGQAHILDDRSGVAVWHAGGQPLPRVASLRRSTVDDAYAARWAALEDVLHQAAADAVRSAGQVLALLVVASRPAAQVADRAAALLDEHHAVLDAAEQIASTAVFSSETRSLLARHGWTSGERGQLPDASAWWPMRRTPNTVHRTGGGTG
jgi:hypothetical protein